MGSCPRVLHVAFSCLLGFSLVLDPRGRLQGLGRKVGSTSEEFENNVGGVLYWDNVSESSGADSPGLSRIKDPLNGCTLQASFC